MRLLCRRRHHRRMVAVGAAGGGCVVAADFRGVDEDEKPPEEVRHLAALLPVPAVSVREQGAIADSDAVAVLQQQNCLQLVGRPPPALQQAQQPPLPADPQLLLVAGYCCLAAAAAAVVALLHVLLRELKYLPLPSFSLFFVR